MNREDLVADTLKKQGMQDAYYKHVYLPEFARDFVLYARSDAKGLLMAYDITEQDLVSISRLPLFVAEVSNYKKIMASSENAAIHLKAVDILDASLHVMQSRLIGGDLPTKDVIAIGKFMAEIIGIGPQGKGKGDIIGPVNTGTVVKINYGANLEDLPMLPSGAPVNETYTKVAHLYDNAKVIDVEHD